MVFSSSAFLFVFLPILLFALWLCKRPESRLLVLTAGGVAFCGVADPRVPFLLGLVATVSYCAAWLYDRQRAHGAPPRGFVAISIVLMVAPLVVFKYWDFLAGTIESLGGPVVLQLGVVAPIAISFFTFNCISYFVDVVEEREPRATGPMGFAAHVSFFPQLVSGPLTRFHVFYARFATVGRVTGGDQTAAAIVLFILGLTKKVLVADTLGRLVNPLLADPLGLSTVAAWATALGFTMQLYFDFGGYSDMAVGLGLLLGVGLQRNFDSPYRATGIRDFWRRWHISLSSWLRDYLFLPINYALLRRTGDFRLLGLKEEYWSYFAATLVTMGIAGLWHGANWTFVLWGLYYGCLLCLEQLFSRRIRRVPVVVRRVVTFLLVVFGWVLFRAVDLRTAGLWIASMLGIHQGSAEAPVHLLALLAACLIAVNVFPEAWELRTRRSRAWALALAVAFFLSLLAMNRLDATFLYYQF